MPIKEQADRYVALLAGCDAETKTCKEKFQLPRWETIPELECFIWSATSFDNPHKQKLREGYLYAEAILYLVARAHERKEIIGDSEYDTWANYIRDFGHHPIMLSAINFAYLHGHITSTFFDELRSLLDSKESERAAEMIAKIYPEFAKAKPGSQAGKNSC